MDGAMRNARRVVLMLMLVLTAASCSRGRKTQSSALSSGPVSVRVENHNWVNVVVYVLHGGQRTRLGLATGSKTTDFTIPYWIVGQVSTIQLQGDAVGSNDRVVTDAVSVRPWMRLAWTLETDLSRSALAIQAIQ
jgi:hypothetical protein